MSWLLLKCWLWAAHRLFGFHVVAIYTPNDDPDAPVLAVHLARDEVSMERSIDDWTADTIQR